MQNPDAIVAPINVALLYQTPQFETHLKNALTELGADVVYEAATARVDRDALEGSGAQVVIVNLDPEIESHLDEVYALLDDARYNVVFNDGTVSSELSGWDQARWARHLAAKMLGRPEIVDPPRPAGAEAPRSPAQRIAAILPNADRVAPLSEDDVTVSVPSPYSEDADVSAALDGLLSHAGPPASLRPVQPDPGEIRALERDVEPAVGEVDIQAESQALAPDIAPSATQVSLPPSHAQETLDFARELDALIDSVPAPFQPQDLAVPASPGAGGPGFERDPAGFDTVDNLGQDEVIEFVELETMSLEPSFERPLSEEDNLIETFEAPLDQSSMKGESEISAAGLGGFADWSLEALDEGGEAETPSTGKPAAAAEAAGAMKFSVEKVSAESFLSGDWSLEALDEGGEANPQKPEAFGVEKVEAKEYLAPQGGDAEKFGEFDTGFKLNLVPMEEAISPEQPSSLGQRIGETVVGTPKDVVKRVVVLGASIGGPEAVREFLALIPPRFPALFLLAQHMGAEFLEPMSAQLAKAVQLTVRNPTHGERVGHGDVIVVPTSRRLLVDADGVVQLAQLAETSSYSPSIDQVLRDVADRFGAAATAIIFSGPVQDGVEGSKYFSEKGGTIWAQDPDTCAISSMIDAVRAAGVVSFVAGPSQLAGRILDMYSKA